MSIRRVPPRISEAASWATESELMTAVASGDQAAFAQLYDLTCARVFGLVAAMIDSRESAAEVLQESYTHVWSHASEFATFRGDVLAWISGIAHRRAVDRLRATEQETTSATSPAHLSTQLDTLPSEQRQCLVLSYFAGLTPQQIATRTDQALGAVRAHTRAGLTHLREHLLPASA